jgi:hypothetical protein
MIDPRLHQAVIVDSCLTIHRCDYTRFVDSRRRQAGAVDFPASRWISLT